MGCSAGVQTLDMKKIDDNKDGKISMLELEPYAQELSARFGFTIDQILMAFDLDNSGFLEKKEFKSFSELHQYQDRDEFLFKALDQKGNNSLNIPLVSNMLFNFFNVKLSEMEIYCLLGKTKKINYQDFKFLVSALENKQF
ncbi:Calmodulin [Spironucleus salmonicida]|uniref:Calmodulin n=1 Tax=Spironucleus salmonicida TaxID=348837 RepID=V6LTE2_9EUKA|nr:Calmodulin [Spironucleus salmonicida]KAH0574288.1 Calmodulin [Spironucleus salmonicida]|eukprot:EST47850.1 Calmodulin [Spironucleus salmonicida]